MSSVELTGVPPPAIRLPRTWKFLGTAVWGTAAFAAMSAGQVAVVFIALAMRGDAFTVPNFMAITEPGAVVLLSVLGGVPGALLVLWFATRVAGRSFVSYLALRRPSRVEVAYGLIASAALLVVLDSTAWIAGYPLSPDFVLDSMRTARDGGVILIALLGLCVAAPIAEEFIFRGFVFRGWSTTRLGPVGAIALSSVLFAVIHLQYGWFYIACIVLIGALFGYLRHRSSSTWLTVITHAFYNLMASLQALWFIS